MRSESQFDRDAKLDELVADYLDRLNAGEDLDPISILQEHPDLGSEILDELRTFVELGFEPGPPRHEALGTLGDYTLRRQIGRGGMGVVYEAWQASMDRVVALKVLPPGIAADDREFHRFMREAKTAGKLDHPNVVHVHGLGVEQQTPYYAMELVEGETLAQILERIKDTDPETETPFGKKDDVRYFHNLAEAFANVADGLQHAHSRGVTHRDIKPSNLILDPDGRLRILDFGLALLEGQESLTLAGDVVGTPNYMSPEQARRKKIKVDHRTDVWSLGATIYEAICGRPPFRGKDHADTLSRIIEHEPIEPRGLNPRVPVDLQTIALKCLRKEAGERYGTAEALGQDLQRFVRGDPIEARPPSRWARLRASVRRHSVSLVGVTALVVLGGVAASSMYESHQARRRERTEELGAQIQRQLRAGEWNEAVARARERLAQSPTSFKSHVSLATALKHLISSSGAEAGDADVVELAETARGAWQLGPDEPLARIVLGSARETIETHLSRRATAGASLDRGFGDALNDALETISTLAPRLFTPGKTITDDFVATPDLWDCRPICWERPSWLHCCQGEFVPSPVGDGIDVWPTGFQDALLVTKEVFSGRVSVRARGVLTGTRSARMSVAIHEGPGATGYVATVQPEPSGFGRFPINIVKWRRARIVKNEGTAFGVDLDEELALELRATETQIELRVWRPGLGEERPERPQVTMVDSEYKVGSVGFGGWTVRGPLSQDASVRFRSFSVTASP